jgi:hypothetical protein
MSCWSNACWSPATPSCRSTRIWSPAAAAQRARTTTPKTPASAACWPWTATPACGRSSPTGSWPPSCGPSPATTSVPPQTSGGWVTAAPRPHLDLPDRTGDRRRRPGRPDHAAAAGELADPRPARQHLPPRAGRLRPRRPAWLARTVRRQGHRLVAALASILVPSKATRPRRTMPAAAHSFSEATSSPAKACSWRTRNRAMVT